VAALLESPRDDADAEVRSDPGRAGPGGWSPFLLAIVLAGVAIRLVLAVATDGSEFDMGSLRMVDEALRHDPLDLYGALNVRLHDAGVDFTNFRWPYPPAFFPWILGSTSIEARTGLSFHAAIELPSIAADAALAWLAYAYAGGRGAAESTRLAAAAAIALGPVFIAISGHADQIDSLAILPVVVAVLVWERRTSMRGVLVAGLLVGLGAAIKTVPLVLLLALLPTVRSRREAGVLIAAAVAVPLAMLAPFAVADPHGVARLADYRGAPGVGGLSLVIQPGLAGLWLEDVTRTLSAPSRQLFEHGSLVTIAALIAVGVTLLRLRTPPRVAAVVVCLALYVFGAGFFFQYLVWGLPFIVLCGWIRWAVLLQAAVLAPLLLFYMRPWESDWPEAVYVPLMIGVWLAMIAALVNLLRGQATRARAAR
jgi:hypothetical protein